MKCIYCQSPTNIVNSRRKTNNETWRRHRCTNCQSVFTTIEAADLDTSLTVRSKTNNVQPFSRDRLFVSVLRSVGHRPRALGEASDLTRTIIVELLKANAGNALLTDYIISTTKTVLSNFDNAAAVQYAAYHQI